MIGNVVVELNGDTATSKAYVCDMHLAPDNNPDEYFRTFGDYHDTWVRDGEQWLINKRIKDNRATLGDINIMRRNRDS